MLTQKGLSPGKSPELWMLENPLPLKEIHRDYLKAGAQVIQTNTFGGANRLKLEEYNAGERVSEINLNRQQKLAREIRRPNKPYSRNGSDLIEAIFQHH